MDKDDFGRIAAGCILGVLSTIVLTKSSTPNEGIVWWLIYSVTVGIVINTQEGKPFRVLLIGSVASAITLVLTLFVRKRALGEIFAISGTGVTPDNLAMLLGMLLGVSVIGILIFSYARNLVVWACQTWFSNQNWSSIEKAINGFVKVLLALGLAVKALS